jgi:hypothetical protein
MMNTLTARELRLLREVAHFFLDGQNCYLCGKPLIEDLDTVFGNKDNRPIKVALTVHHRDESHTNNERSNRVWTHKGCHHSFHARRILHGQSISEAEIKGGKCEQSDATQAPAVLRDGGYDSGPTDCLRDRLERIHDAGPAQGEANPV